GGQGSLHRREQLSGVAAGAGALGFQDQRPRSVLLPATAIYVSAAESQCAVWQPGSRDQRSARLCGVAAARFYAAGLFGAAERRLYARGPAPAGAVSQRRLGSAAARIARGSTGSGRDA